MLADGCAHFGESAHHSTVFPGMWNGESDFCYVLGRVR